MPEHTETQALAEYVADRGDASFERLVGNHIDMVFGCALRRCGDRQLSEEISQNVFAILARKAHKLTAGAGLAGWLHKTTLYETKKALRGESRRNRKMKALAEHALTQNENRDPASAGDGDILPLVDEAIDELPDADRHLLLMRFFEGKNFREIAQATGKSEAASQKQASRALEKLSRVLKRRGVVATTTALGTVLAAESAKAAPAGIIATVSTGAAATATTLSTSTLITNAVQTMTYAKTKIAIFAAAAAAVPIGAQWNAIGNLKEDVQVYQEREVEFVQQGERLAKLEKQIESLPEGFLSAYSETRDVPGTLGTVAMPTAQQLKQQMERDRLTAMHTGGIGWGSTAGKTNGDGSESEETLETEEEENPLETAMASYAEMMKNPSMRALMKQQMVAQLEVSHGNFLRHVTEDEGKREQIKQLILDRNLALADEGMELTKDGSIDLTDTSGLTDVSDEYEEQLRQMLGEKSWEEFERFEDSAPERQELSTFRDVLEEDGHELTFETEQQLMAIMYEERMNHDYAPLTDDLDLENFSLNTSTETMQRYVREQRVLQERIRSRVGGVLNAQQLETFEQNQNSHLEMLESSVEMSNQFLNGAEGDSEE